jgi:hypothetical protein
MSIVTLQQNAVSQLAAQAEAVGGLAQDTGAFAAAVAAFESNDPDAFGWVLQRLEMVPQCELVCEWLRVKLWENMAYPMYMKAGGTDDWQMSWIGTDALLFQNPMKAVTFVSSLDSETDGRATIINNKSLGLALMWG